MPTVAVMVATAVVAAMAISASGQHVQRVDTNNAALWVSNDDGGLYGRFNKASSNLELLSHAGEGGAGASADVLQDGNTVLAQNLSSGLLIPVDTATGADGHDQAAAVGAAQVDLRGGTLAVLDPASGKLWAMRTQGTSHMLELSGFDPSTPPLAELGAAAGGGAHLTGLSVGSDGSVHAASVAGKQVTITPTELGFDVPAYSQLPAGFKTVQVAALGAQAAVLDGTTGTLVLPGGRTTQVPADPKAELQQGGGDVGNVAVATSTSLYRVGYDGTVTELFTQGSGAPAMPVNLGESVASGSCVLGAWAGSPGKVARSCNGAPATDVSGSRDEALQDPAFRVNWNLVVLNDRATGRIYDVDLQQSFNDWKSILALEKQDQEKEEKEVVKPTDAKPKAKDDEYGARPNRTSVLHVLDNDSDPNGRVLSISKVEQPKNGASVLIAPDGQTLQYQQPKEGRDASFTYTINNDRGEATARVTVKAENGNENQPPQERLNFAERTYAVPSAGTVTVPVVGDYRDYDGDPITVIAAADGKEDVPVTSDGQIEYTAPKGGKTAQGRLLTFKVTDGNSTAIPGKVHVTIAGTDDTTGIAPIAQADAVKGEVGRMISVTPLANDIAGVDPGDENTRLSLAADVDGWKDAKVTTDRDSGRVTFVSKHSGVHWVHYKAAFGSAPTADGMIRVDVLDKVDQKPVAMPDQAVIRGSQAITVDVLANDSDPHGGLLTVQSATANNENQIQVAVVQGRWLRIVPSAPEFSPNPQSVTYEIINGDGVTAIGSVTLTHLPALDEDAPLVRADTATVRAGDTTLIPVLANDLTLGGSTLTLATNVEGAPPGQLTVKDPTRNADADQGDVGTAYVVGNQVRYIAPKTVTEAMDVDIQYVAKAGRRGATGDITVTVNPEPTDANPDSPPQPTTIEGRATAGDTITIPVRASGQDPDGDSVALAGLGSGPQLGRITRITAKGITYQAFPTADSLGTDQFTYVVTDKYGQTGTGTIRVAVVPPGQTQPPITVDDLVTAKPGVPVHIDVIANDLIAMSDRVKIKPLVNAPAGVTLAGDQGPITATAPAAKAEATTIQYTLTGNGGESPVGTVKVLGQDGYVNPPRLKDQLATSDDGKVATVDVLADAWDPDGANSDLTVESVSDPEAKVLGGKVTVPVRTAPQVLSYTVVDADKGSSAALIYVPGSGDGSPYAKGAISLESKTATISLSDYVVSPRGRGIRITTVNTVSVSPKNHLKAKASSDLTKVELTVDDYVGPATLNLEATDGSSLTDPDARTAVVSIPIQVGPDTPVIRCPDDAQTITRGTTGKAMDIIGLCHVWTADPATLPTLAFAASWEGPALSNVSPTVDGQSLVLQATGDAHPGDKASLSITIPGSRAVPAVLTVLVKDARLARYKAEQLEVKQGETVTGRIALDSPIQVGRQDTIVAMPPLPGATSTFNGADWSVTADPTFDGPLAYQLTLSDVANTDIKDRQIQGVLTVSVYGIPAVPAAPTGGKTAQNHAVTLTWKRPAKHGATIEKYMVRQSGGRHDGVEVPCDTEISCTISGLDNDVPVRFQVKAYNKAGWSDYGPWSAEFRPDRVPDAVTGFRTSDPMDHRISLSWNAVQSTDFSPVTSYEITWPGGHARADGSATSKLIPNSVANQKTTFLIWAKNRTGKSRKAAKATGWPSGAPDPFSITKVEANRNADSSAVSISWETNGANGEPPLEYVVHDGNAVVAGCERVKSKGSCRTDAVVMNGDEHRYTVSATNKPKKYTTTTKSYSWTAIGLPEDPTKAPQAQPNGANGEVDLSGSAGNSRGKSSFVKVTGGGQTERFSVSGGKWAGTMKLGAGSNGHPASFSYVLCNESDCSDPSPGSGDVRPYGPLGTMSVDWHAEGGVLVATASADANGANAVLSISTNGCSDKTSGLGSLSMTLRCDVGYSQSRTFEYKLTSTDSHTSGREEQVARRDGSTPAPPRALSVREGSYIGTGRKGCEDANCRWVLVSSSGFSGSVSCTVSSTGSSNWESFTLPGNVSNHNTGVYFGYFGRDLWVNCDGTESNHEHWDP